MWKSGPEDTSVFECLQKIKAHKTYVLKVLFSPVRILFLALLYLLLTGYCRMPSCWPQPLQTQQSISGLWARKSTNYGRLLAVTHAGCGTARSRRTQPI